MLGILHLKYLIQILEFHVFYPSRRCLRDLCKEKYTELGSGDKSLSLGKEVVVLEEKNIPVLAILYEVGLSLVASAVEMGPVFQYSRRNNKS